MKVLFSVRRLGLRNQPSKPGVWLETLENRTLLSDFAHSLASPDYVRYHAAGQVSPLGTTGPMGDTPSQIRHAYGFDQITLAGGVAGDGSGTTIAIVDAFDDPNIANDLQQFDAQFDLPNPSFTKVNEGGGLLLPPVDSTWANEIALDVEWSHAIAPGAKILLVEANDNTFANMFAGVIYAARQPGVVAVSMSWTGGEDSTETSYDKDFLTASGHSGVTFVAASGDSGATELPGHFAQRVGDRRHDLVPGRARQLPQRTGVERERRRDQYGGSATRLPARRGQAEHDVSHEPRCRL